MCRDSLGSFQPGRFGKSSLSGLGGQIMVRRKVAIGIDPGTNMKGWNLHIVRNDVMHDSRVLKETASLADSGLFDKVAIAGLHNGLGNEHEEMDKNRSLWRVPLRTRKLPKDLLSQAIKFAEWQRRIVTRYKDTPVRVIHCHDLAPLPIAVALKKRTGARIVYDAHELETEMFGLAGFRKWLTKHLERRLIRHVDAMITVSPSIKAWYEAAFPGIPVTLVRNVPERPCTAQPPVDLKGTLGAPDDELLFIYLGGLSRGRGIDLLLDAFSRPGVSHHLLFMGDGVLREKILAKSRTNRRIHWLAPVAMDKVVAHARGADVGISMIEDTCVSYRYCLPNKLFEYIMAGLPVLASNLPDQADFIRELDGGWVINGAPEDTIEKLQKISRETFILKKKNILAYNGNVSWNAESSALIDLYREMN